MQLVMCDKQRGHFERNQLPYRADRVDELLELLLEPFALAFAIGAARHAGNECATEPGLDQPRFCRQAMVNHASGFVVIAFLRVVQRRFVTHHRAYRVGKRPFGIFAAGIAHQIDLVGEPVIESHEGAVSERAVGVQFGWTGRIEI